MAKTRDIVIGVIIGVFFLAFLFLMVVFMFSAAASDGVEFTGFGDKVAVIRIHGAVYSSRDICRQLDRWAEDSRVQAIVLDINSPGGGVAPSQEIFQKVLDLREETGKPVIASMASVCASGGYMIACAADRIVANAGSLTGSIGVIVQWAIYDDLLGKVGVQMETVKSGEVKDIGSPYRQPTEEDIDVFQAVVDDAYQQFVEVLVSQRGLSTTEVLQVADGSIFTGRQAKDLGLVDEIGTYEEAINLAGELAGIGENPDVVIESPRRTPTIWDLVGSLVGIDFSGFLESDRQVYPRLSYLLI
jgi:protease-4